MLSDFILFEKQIHPEYHPEDGCRSRGKFLT